MEACLFRGRSRQASLRRARIQVLSSLAVIALSSLILVACGKALPFNSSSDARGQATGGGSSSGGSGTIYPVTMVFQASSMTSWTATQRPFIGNLYGIGTSFTDAQVGFDFSYTYPPNNFQLAEAHLVIDTQRDSSDTEGIFIDGVFSGRPPGGRVNATQDLTGVLPPAALKKIYEGSGVASPNTYFNSFSVAHYKVLTINTFDLDLFSLVDTTGGFTGLTPYDLVSDGWFPVFTGDDSPVFQGFLILKGYTIASGSLTCTSGQINSFENVYVHNDGNTVSGAAFSGTVRSPYRSLPAQNARDAVFQSVEFYYDATFPGGSSSSVVLSTGSLSLSLAKQTTGGVGYESKAAIVVNGIGIAQSGFDTSRATTQVESWRTDPVTLSKWENLVSSWADDDTLHAVTINLADLYGTSTLKSLIAQGKLNVALAGSIAVVSATNDSSARVVGSPAVNGPEFSVEGTYAADSCQVPNNPDSPLSGAGTESPSDDGTPPVISSVQVSEISSSSAKVIWLTDEKADSRVQYGPGPTPDGSWSYVPVAGPQDVAPSNVTFHSVELSGLIPYTYYFYRVISKDKYGNSSTSEIRNLRTLR